MFHKILFPTDFSTTSSHALLHAMRLSGFSKGEVIVQHVVNDYFQRYPQWTTLFDVRELEKHMDVFIHGEMEKVLAPPHDGVSLRRVISKGKPAEEICALAEKEFVDLVVMGSAKAVVTNKVVRTTTRPVLAVPAVAKGHGAGEIVGEMRRILIATDFSEHARKVAHYAFDLPMAANAEIFLMHVIEMTRAIEFAVEQSHYSNTMLKMKEWAMNQLTNSIPGRLIGDPRVQRIVESGVASDRIAETAASIGADLVVLGTHEHGATHRFLLGTTTDRLLTTMPTPILTVRL